MTRALNKAILDQDVVAVFEPSANTAAWAIDLPDSALGLHVTGFVGLSEAADELSGRISHDGSTILTASQYRYSYVYQNSATGVSGIAATAIDRWRLSMQGNNALMPSLDLKMFRGGSIGGYGRVPSYTSLSSGIAGSGIGAVIYHGYHDLTTQVKRLQLYAPTGYMTPGTRLVARAF